MAYHEAECPRCGLVFDDWDVPVLQWTTEPPTTPGWYWLDHWHKPAVVEVWELHAGELVFSEDDECATPVSIGKAWAGPIPEPER